MRLPQAGLSTPEQDQRASWDIMAPRAVLNAHDILVKDANCEGETSRLLAEARCGAPSPDPEANLEPPGTACLDFWKHLFQGLGMRVSSSVTTV